MLLICSLLSLSFFFLSLFLLSLSFQQKIRKAMMIFCSIKRKVVLFLHSLRLIRFFCSSSFFLSSFSLPPHSLSLFCLSLEKKEREEKCYMYSGFLEEYIRRNFFSVLITFSFSFLLQFSLSLSLSLSLSRSVILFLSSFFLHKLSVLERTKSKERRIKITGQETSCPWQKRK